MIEVMVFNVKMPQSYMAGHQSLGGLRHNQPLGHLSGDPEDGDVMFLQNNGIPPHHYMTSQLQKPQVEL
jgi:hypothetical protein